ncbi:hypothetical protein JVU11DRAFT_182 [Chiua virens]|nr:hypothetical protein JVU11DRAFT_182 [Chiua virens]
MIQSLQSFTFHYWNYALAPLAPFSWFGLNISSLELAGAFRLCYVLRYLREHFRDEHVKQRAKDTKLPPSEDRSFVRNALTVLTVVYGGEAIAAPLLGVPCSFMNSGTGPLLYVLVQALVDALPYVPSYGAELRAADVLFRCSYPPWPEVSNSPWALILSSFIITNAGFFTTNLVSFLHPTPLTFTTPPELQPYGWTTVDLWSAPLITAIYATLTHCQPFWADLHAVIAGVLGVPADAAFGAGVDKVAVLDPDTARFACAIVFTGLFASRTVKTFGLAAKRGGVWFYVVARG